MPARPAAKAAKRIVKKTRTKSVSKAVAASKAARPKARPAPVKRVAQAKPALKRRPVVKAAPVPKRKPVAKAAPVPKRKAVAKAAPAPKRKPVAKAAPAPQKKKAAAKAAPAKRAPLARAVARPVKVKPARPVKLSPEMQKFRETLLSERARLEAELEEIESRTARTTDAERATELSSYEDHPADLASETFEREKDLAIAESVESLLNQVNTALEKLERGTYGVCDACGRPIKRARLQALPFATLCLECQDRLEG